MEGRMAGAGGDEEVVGGGYGGGRRRGWDGREREVGQRGEGDLGRGGGGEEPREERWTDAG